MARMNHLNKNKTTPTTMVLSNNQHMVLVNYSSKLCINIAFHYSAALKFSNIIDSNADTMHSISPPHKHCTFYSYPIVKGAHLIEG